MADYGGLDTEFLVEDVEAIVKEVSDWRFNFESQ
jgi:hypothetical protein